MCFTVKTVLGCRAVQLGRWRDMMSGKEEFIEIFREKITRPGADAVSYTHLDVYKRQRVFPFQSERISSFLLTTELNEQL